jgi:hypothetical protein
VALRKEQYPWMKQAIANWPEVQETLRRMEQLSRQVLFQNVPGNNQCKPLSNNVMVAV